MEKKHKWTDQECIIVCTVFKNEIIKSHKSIEFAVVQIKNQCPDLKTSSIRMKIANTVAICNEVGIEHYCGPTNLTHYSQQHRRAFKEVFGV